MDFRTSFRTKLLFLTIAPLAIAQIVAFLVLQNTALTEARERANKALLTGRGVVDEVLRTRLDRLRSAGVQMAEDPALIRAWTDGDANLLDPLLKKFRHRAAADIVLLLDHDGDRVAGTLPMSPAFSGARLAGSAEEQQHADTTLHVSGTTYHVVTNSVRSGRLRGVLAIGYELGEPLANQLAGLTGLDVTIARRGAAGFDVIAAANPQPAEQMRIGHKTLWSTAEAATVTAGDPDGQLLRLVVPLSAATPSLFVVLEQTIEHAGLVSTESGHALILFAVLLMAGVSLIAVLFSGRIARPLRSLTSAAHRMISGDYNARIAIESGDEFGELAASFDSMRLAIAEREQHISHQALHNSLTDLPNRDNILLQLATAIDAARDNESSVVVLSIRFIGMDEISSTIGHRAADELIIRAAEQIQINLNPGDCIGHTGSSEFVLILRNQDTGDALATAERLAGTLESGVSLERVNISLQTHMGIAEYPSHGNAPDELLRFAAIARTDALQGKEPVCVYRPGREDEFTLRLRVVNDLRSAISGGELQVWYQPKAHLPAGAICGAEALVRWHHPELGFLPPNEFIPAAERAGTIMHLTRYVLGEAIRQCRAWQDAGHPIAISVNLATRDLLDDYLPYHVLQLLKENDLPAQRLTLEITETSIMDHLNQAMLVLDCLRDMGVGLSMDDFGTGHSSLAQLRSIPLNELKIDRSFIMALGDDSQDQAIVRNTIELAHSMNLRVVAEGVEDEATMRRLAEMGCEQAQGYFLCRPIPAIEVIEWLDAFRPTCYAERRKSGRAFG